MSVDDPQIYGYKKAFRLHGNTIIDPRDIIASEFEIAAGNMRQHFKQLKDEELPRGSYCIEIQMTPMPKLSDE